MKKLLSILGAVGLVATGSTTVVACGQKGPDIFPQAISEKNSEKLVSLMKYVVNNKKWMSSDLGELNDLKPLQGKDDGNIFNTDNKSKSVHTSFGYEDYSDADDKIGTYEIAKAIFDKISKVQKDNNAKSKDILAFNYMNLYGLEFTLTGTKESGYKMNVKASNGQNIDFTFTSDKDIQLSLNSVIKVPSDAIEVPNGDIESIAKAVQVKLNPTDSKVKLAVNKNINPDGIQFININDEGKGMIRFYDSSQTYGGYVYPKITIINYQKGSLDK